VRSWTATHIAVSIRSSFRGFQARRQQGSHLFVGKGRRAATGVMNYEEFTGTEQLVADHKRANRIVAGTSTCITNYVRIAFAQARKL
jgi:hypothetical protein